MKHRPRIYYTESQKKLGVCAYNQTSQSQPEDLIGAADKALYVAKASGRNMSVIAN